MPDTSKIKEHMEVFGSCGKKVGLIDKVEGISIKLTKDTGGHHYIPVDWVDHVDQHVHLRKPCADVQMEWQGHPVQAGEYMPEGK